MGSRHDHILPFPALVGQADLKLGLLLNVVNPRIGGLLIQGPKGAGKSTVVYAVARLLPQRMESATCPYRCVPEYDQYLCEECRTRIEKGGQLDCEPGRMRVVPLPLSTTEGRLVGSIDMEKMLSRGEKALPPGLLAAANSPSSSARNSPAPRPARLARHKEHCATRPPRVSSQQHRSSGGHLLASAGGLF